MNTKSGDGRIKFKITNIGVECSFSPEGTRLFNVPLCDDIIKRHLLKALRQAGAPVQPGDDIIIPSDYFIEEKDGLRWLFLFEVYTREYAGGWRYYYKPTHRGFAEAYFTSCRKRTIKVTERVSKIVSACRIESIEGEAAPVEK